MVTSQLHSLLNLKLIPFYACHGTSLMGIAWHFHFEYCDGDCDAIVCSW